jgi:hypothetical protein
MKNKFKRITGGLIVGMLGSLMLSSLASAQRYTGPVSPIITFPPGPTPIYKRIILKPYIGKVTLQRTGQPDITRWAAMSQGCNSNYITANTSWAPLTPTVDNDLSNGSNPVFLITKVSQYASTTYLDYQQCKVLIPDNADYATYVQGTTQYRFEVSDPLGPVLPSTPGGAG